MRNYLRRIRFWSTLAFVTGLLIAVSGAMQAQEQQNSPAESTSRKDLDGRVVEHANGDSAAPDASANAPQQDAQAVKSNQAGEYVPALTGDQVFYLGSIPNFRLLYGATLSQPVTGESLTFASPYVGVAAASNRTQFVLQYAPTIMHRWAARQRTAMYEAGSIFLHHEINRRWRIAFSLDSRYGDNAVRLLATPSFGVSGDVSMINPNSFVVEPALRELFTNNATLDLRWRPTLRRQIVFSTQELYREASTGGLQSAGHANLAAFQVAWEESFTPQFKLIGSARTRRIYEATPCDSYGASLGMSFKTLRGLVFEVGAGPEFASGGTCQTRQGVTAQASVGVPMGKGSHMYVSYDRSFNGLFISPRIQSRDYVGFGFQKLLSHGIAIHFESGYYRIRQCCGFDTTEGYYFSPMIGWAFPLSRSASIQVNYRSFFRQVDQLGIGRNKLILTLQWKPTPRGMVNN